MRIVLVLAMLLAGGTAHAAAPDLRACEQYKPGDEGENPHLFRKRPVPVPRAAAGMVRSDMDHFAVATLSGGTVCVDARWIETTDDAFALSPDGRFLSFGWEGYEAFGHRVIDRSGAGQDVETGAEPVFSPSGKRLAAVSLSDSGYGALEGFTVWDVGTEGLTEAARLEDIPYAAVWRIDRWAGDHCIELSAVANKDAPADPREIESGPRTRYAARLVADGWKLRPSPIGCAVN